MEKILLADDDAEVLEIATTILSKEGYEVIPAKDGDEAIEKARAKPDVILLDYLMPGKSGIEVLTVLKKDPELKMIPVIMVTAHPMEKERSLSAGAVDFVVKPVEKTDLLLRIKSVLKVRHINNELQKIIAYIDQLQK